MENETQHNIRVLTRLWHSIQKKKTDNNNGQMQQAQNIILQAAFEEFELMDQADHDKLGVRVPVLKPVKEIMEEIQKQG